MNFPPVAITEALELEIQAWLGISFLSLMQFQALHVGSVPNLGFLTAPGTAENGDCLVTLDSKSQVSQLTRQESSTRATFNGREHPSSQ